MATLIWIDIGSGNGLVLSAKKPLPKPMLTSLEFCGYHLRAISSEVPMNLTNKMRSDFPLFYLLRYLYTNGLNGNRSLFEHYEWFRDVLFIIDCLRTHKTLRHTSISVFVITFYVWYWVISPIPFKVTSIALKQPGRIYDSKPTIFIKKTKKRSTEKKIKSETMWISNGIYTKNRESSWCQHGWVFIIFWSHDDNFVVTTWRLRRLS